MTTAAIAEAVAKNTTASRKVPFRTRTITTSRRDSHREHRPAPAPRATWTRPLPGRVSVPDTSASIHAAPPVLLWKRVLDILCILLTLPITLPLMALVGMWIKLVSRGPAIFRQERIGRNGRRFTLYKFRSMHAEADTRRHTSHFAHLVSSNSPMVKLDLLDDSRLIPAGCLLRAAALDELPQLFNVLRGEMSLVGPRPCLPEEYRFFSPAQRVRFEALPGMTGIWQVMGKEACTFTEMNEMDARYVRQCAPLLDLSIMLRTPLAVLRQMSLACQRRHAALWKASFAGRGEKHIPGYHTQKLG